jgi:ornithine cyclodeaminase/alanine dehydrogenase
MTLFFNEDDVASLLTMDDAIEQTEKAFLLLGERKAVNRPRARVRANAITLHVMTAGAEAFGSVGLKAYTTGRSGARFYYLLFDDTSGEFLALMEADRLGQIRTGAASGVATRYLACEDASRVGVFGTGWQARSQLQAIASVRPIESVRAFSRNEEKRKRFAVEMSEELGVPVETVNGPELVCQDADIVVVATNAREPVLKGMWLRPGQHVNAIGSNALGRREVDELAVRRASIIFVDSLEQAKIECGDLAAVVEAGKLGWESVHELGDLVSGTEDVPSRSRADEITLFESQGLAIEDVAAAKRVYDLGRERGVGVDLSI